MKIPRSVLIIPLLLLCCLVGGCRRAEKAFNRVVQENTDEAYTKFINDYAGTEWAGKARQEWETSSFHAAEGRGTVAAYGQFLAKFPASKLCDKARGAIESLDLESALQAGTVAALRSFLEKYPASANRPKAEARLQSKLYQEAISSKSVFNLQECLARYPDNAAAQEAREVMESAEFEAANRSHSVGLIEDALKKYPKSKLREEAFLNLGLFQGDEAKAKASLEAWSAEFPDSKFKGKALSRLAEIGLGGLERAPGRDQLNAFKANFPVESLPEGMRSRIGTIEKNLAQQELKAGRSLVVGGVKVKLFAASGDEFGPQGKLNAGWHAYRFNWKLEDADAKNSEQYDVEIVDARGKYLALPGLIEYLNSGNIVWTAIPDGERVFARLKSKTEVSESIELP